jgi:hypothetical protein
MTKVALAFTEEMQGVLNLEPGMHRLTFQITVKTDDVERFLGDDGYPARVSGRVRCDALGGLLDVEGGHFRLAVDGDRPRWEYRLLFRDHADHPLALTGAKQGSGAAALHAQVLAGHEPGAPVVATAVLETEPDEFARQLTSVRVSPPLRLDARARFGALFAGPLWDSYR